MSGSGSTLESSPSEPTARAHYYHNKLLATLQILDNKEETVRVQKESLEMAEQRIASLSTRVIKLKQELDRRGLELQSLKNPSNKHHEEKTNISATTSEKEVENLKKVITTLQYNLSVIEELYRECFYETAKQEELVEMLRKSYLDVRLTEKEKSEEIGNLQNVINTQKWSLEQCQDIAVDVDHLKVEISNFLNNSNNDSGMWERSDESLPTSVTDDLHDIAEQLEHLKLLLKEDCLCGFEQENKRLKEVNENMNSQICAMRRRISELEAVVSENENKEQSYQEKINVKQQQLNEVQQELIDLKNARSQCNECESLVLQLQEYKSLLSERDEELKALQTQCDVREANISELKEKLNKTNLVSSEKCAMRREMAVLSRQVASWHAQLRSADTLQRELAECRKQYDYLLKCYSEKSRSCEALEQALSSAEQRGAKLCADSRRTLDAVRSWVCQLRNQRKKQEKKISEQATIICELRCRLRESRGEQSSDEPTCCRPSETESCHAARASGMGRCNEARVRDMTASCSTAKSTPIPPRRTFRKKPSPMSCGHDGSLSPSEEVLERIEHLQDALRARWSRWTRPHHQHPQ